MNLKMNGLNKKLADGRDVNANLSDVSSNYADSLSLDVGRRGEDMRSPKPANVSSVLIIPTSASYHGRNR